MLLCFDLATLHAVLAALGLAVLYVSSLYIWPQKFHRNHPTAVKQRIVSAVLVTLVAPWYMALFGAPCSNPRHSLVDWVGLTDPASALLPLALTMLLFAGPLYQHYITAESLLSDYNSYSDVLLLRNLLVAPVTEELVYRSCLAPLVIVPLGWTTTVLTLPLFFGVAHLHHACGMYRGGAPLLQIIATVLIQTLFTSAFGAYSTLVFLTTGSVLGPILCHMFCNSMGLPDLASISHTNHKLSIWSAHVAGLVGFLVLTPYCLTCDNFNSLYCSL